MEESRSRRYALTVAEVLLVLAMVVAPLLLGAVRLWSLAVVAGLVGAAAVAAALGRERRVPWPVWMAAGLALWTGLAALPLPRALLAVISPRGLELVELSLGTVTSHSLSLDPAGTARECARLLALMLGMAVASRLAADEGAARRLLHAVAALTVLQCLFIIGHKVVATSSVYGVFLPKQFSHVLGTFSNANLLAAYLSLGVPVMLVLAARSRERGDAIAWLSVAAVTMVMTLLTASRSGLGGLLTSLVVLAVLLRHRLREHRGVLAGLVGVLVVSASSSALLDRNRAEKLASLVRPTHLYATDLKVRAWRDVPALIRDYWPAGIGRGAFETVFPAYKRVSDVVTFTHAECAPLQLLSDYGLLVGTAVMVAWLAALVLGARQRLSTSGREERPDERLLRDGAAAALAGITVHELGDFSLDVSAAVGVQVSVLFGVLWPARRLPSRPDDDEGRLLRLWRRVQTRVGLAVAALVLGAGCLVFAARGEIGRDVEAVREASIPGANLEPLVRQAIARHPGEPWFHFIAGLDRIRHRQPRAALHYLNRALLLDPTSWRPHLATAEALFLLGKSEQGVLELRLAYLGSAFDDTVAVSSLSHREFTGPDAARTIASFSGGNPAVLAAYANYLDRARRDDLTAEAAGQLLALRPDDLGAQRLLARADLRRGRFEAALAHARKLPANDPEGLLLQVQSLDGLGRGAESDTLLEGIDRSQHEGAGRQLAPETVMLLADRALQHGKSAAALAALEQVVQDGLGPEELAHLHLLRASALDKEGRLAEATAEVKAAARINPCETTWLAQGGLYERAGLLREALLVYRGAVRSMPHPSPTLLERRARLEQALGAPTINGGTQVERSPLESLPGSEGEREDDDSEGEGDTPQTRKEVPGSERGFGTESEGTTETWRPAQGE